MLGKRAFGAPHWPYLAAAAPAAAATTADATTEAVAATTAAVVFASLTGSNQLWLPLLLLLLLLLLTTTTTEYNFAVSNIITNIRFTSSNLELEVLFRQPYSADLSDYNILDNNTTHVLLRFHLSSNLVYHYLEVIIYFTYIHDFCYRIPNALQPLKPRKTYAVDSLSI